MGKRKEHRRAVDRIAADRFKDGAVSSSVERETLEPMGDLTRKARQVCQCRDEHARVTLNCILRREEEWGVLCYQYGCSRCGSYWSERESARRREGASELDLPTGLANAKPSVPGPTGSRSPSDISAPAPSTPDEIEADLRLLDAAIEGLAWAGPKARIMDPDKLIPKSREALARVRARLSASEGGTSPTIKRGEQE